MVAQGFSHFALKAKTPETFQDTIRFYQRIGFRKLLDQIKEGENALPEYDDEADEEHERTRRVWLKLGATQNTMTTNIIIKLSLCAAVASSSRPRSNDVDWGMVDNAMVLLVKDTEVNNKDIERK